MRLRPWCMNPMSWLRDVKELMKKEDNETSFIFTTVFDCIKTLLKELEEMWEDEDEDEDFTLIHRRWGVTRGEREMIWSFSLTAKGSPSSSFCVKIPWWRSCDLCHILMMLPRRCTLRSGLVEINHNQHSTAACNILVVGLKKIKSIREIVKKMKITSQHNRKLQLKESDDTRWLDRKWEEQLRDTQIPTRSSS